MSLRIVDKINAKNQKNIIAFSKARKGSKEKKKTQIIARYRKFDFDNLGIESDKEGSGSESETDSDDEKKPAKRDSDEKDYEEIENTNRDYYLFPRSSSEKHNTYRDVYLIIGASGSGKSWQAMIYIKNYISIYQENRIYIFTPVPQDESLEPIADHPNVVIINANDPINKDDYKLENMTDSLFVFDDICAVSGENQKIIDEIRDKILETGRHFGQCCLVTEHSFKAEKRIIKAMNESTVVCIFVSSGDYERLKKFLQEKVGLGMKQVREVLSIKSNQVIILKTAPLTIIYQNGIKILTNPLLK